MASRATWWSSSKPCADKAFRWAVGGRRRAGDGRAWARRPRGVARASRAVAAPVGPSRHLRRDVRPVLPGALGARTVLDEDSDDDGLPPEDVEAMRQMLLDMLTDNEELANMDERLAAMIAQIVEAYGRYNSSRGPSYSSQALKAMNLDDLEGRLPACLRRTATNRRRRRSRSPRPLRPNASRSCARWSRARRSAARPSSWAATTCRCGGAPASRTSSSCAPPASNCARCCAVATAGPYLATRLAARRRSRAGEIDLRKTLRKSMSTGGVPIDVVLKKPHPARPRSWWCCATCRARSRASATSPCYWFTRCGNSFPCPRLRLHRHHRRGHRAVRPDADLAVAVQRITREAVSTPATPLRLRARVRVVPRQVPERFAA